MTIRYHNTFRDLLGFCFYHYPRSPVVIGTYGLGLAVIALLIGTSLPKELSTTAKVLTFVFAETAALLALASFFIVSVVVSMISRRNKTFLTEHTITLAEGGFTTETRYTKSEHKWTLVQKLARTRAYTFMYTAQYMAHVVPRRAFRDNAEWDAFYEYCRRHVGAA